MRELYLLCKEIELLASLPYDHMIESEAFSVLSGRFVASLQNSDIHQPGEFTRSKGPDHHRLGLFEVANAPADRTSPYTLAIQAYAECDPSPAHLRLSVRINNKSALTDLIAFECAARQALAGFSPTELKALFHDSFAQPFEVDAYTIDEIGPLITYNPQELLQALKVMISYSMEASKEDESTWQRVMRSGGSVFEAFSKDLGLTGGKGGSEAGDGGDLSFSGLPPGLSQPQPLSICRNLALPLDEEWLALNIRFFSSIKRLLWASVNVVPKAMQAFAR